MIISARRMTWVWCISKVNASGQNIHSSSPFPLYRYCFKEEIYNLFHFQAPPKQVPRTIENTRISDETIVVADDEEVTHLFHVTALSQCKESKYLLSLYIFTSKPHKQTRGGVIGKCILHMRISWLFCCSNIITYTFCCRSCMMKKVMNSVLTLNVKSNPKFYWLLVINQLWYVLLLFNLKSGQMIKASFHLS